jgi:hypothetical protein
MLCKKCENISNSSGYVHLNPWIHCHHEEEKKEIIACKLIDPQNQCQDWSLKIQKGWCKDCINHVFVPVEPEKKEKCWCEYSNRLRQVTGFEDERIAPNGRIYKEKTFLIKYCPVCGRKLNET